MQYLKAIDGVVADADYTFAKLRQDYPDYSFPASFFDDPANLTAYNVFPYTISTPPVNTDELNYEAVRQPLQLIAGEWTVRYELVERTDEAKLGYSESNGDWDTFNFGLASIAGFSAWVLTVQQSADAMFFEILRGALINRNLRGMQASYNQMSSGNKPSQDVRIAMQQLAIACGILLNFLAEGDQLP
jgi:hypothetical protein